MNLAVFAFRNILRNRKRTLLTATAILFAAMIAALTHGWTNGVLDMYFQNIVKYQTGNLRITSAGFLKREKFFPVDEVVPGDEELLDRIRGLPGVESAEERLKFGIALGAGDKTVYAVGMGIDLKNSILDIPDKVISGQFTNGGLWIGEGLREKLGVQVGDELLLAAKTFWGGLNGIKLPVRGIVRIGVASMDDKMFFLSLFDAKRLLKIRAAAAEILVFTKSSEEIPAVRDALKTVLPSGAVAQTMPEQLKTLYDLFSVGKGIFYYMEALILLLASFVVINTMMMSVFERTREIGTLKAMGMTDREIFINFLYEGAMIGAIGGLIGGLTGYALVLYFRWTGLDLRFAMSGMDMPVDYIMRPSISPDILVVTILLSILIPMLSTIIPARRAWKLMPSEALRKL